MCRKLVETPLEPYREIRCVKLRELLDPEEWLAEQESASHYSEEYHFRAELSKQLKIKAVSTRGNLRKNSPNQVIFFGIKNTGEVQLIEGNYARTFVHICGIYYLYYQNKQIILYLNNKEPKEIPLGSCSCEECANLQLRA